MYNNLITFLFFVRWHWMRVGSLLAIASLVAGCATVKTLEPAQSAAVQNVGVISLLPTDLLYQKVGITVFNNELASKPVASTFNDAARVGVESAFKGAKRNVKQLQVNAPEVKELFKPGAIVFSWPPEKAKVFLGQLAKQHALDTIAVVEEVYDSDNGYAGVRYFLRAGFGDIQFHGIRADIHVTLYDAQGNVLISRSTDLGAIYHVNRPGGKVWTYKLEENLDDETNEQVISSVKKIIAAKTANQIQTMGLVIN
jgi:hypothetical protein